MKIDTLGSEKSKSNVSTLVTIQDYNILFDCGIPLNKNLKLNSIVITHSHISHCEHIFNIINKGFNGKIITSQATSILLPFIFEEYFLTNFNFSKKFIIKLIDKLKKFIFPLKYNQLYNLNDRLNIRLKPAYHILGSSFVELDIREETRISKKIVYTGDLGPTETPILQSFKSPWKADILVMESFFGDKIHPPPKERVQILKNLLKQYKTIIIPEFSIGRIQEFIFDIRKISDIPIYFDSPVADKIYEMYEKLKPFFLEECIKKIKNKEFLYLENLNFITTEEEHKSFLKKIKKETYQKIVISSSNNFESKRTLDYYIHLKDDKEVKFIKLREFLSYSCHADKRNLRNFVKKMRYKPEKIYFIHGNKTSYKALENEILSS